MHARELGREVEDLLVGEGANFGCRVDVEAGHEALRVLGPDAVERFEGTLERVLVWREV